MMDQRALKLKVGLFVLITLAILIFFVFIFGGTKTLFTKIYILNTSFTNTAGLNHGAAVRLSGVRIGSVKGIEFPSDPDINLIRVVMNVREEGMKRISPDSVATIQTEGLLGDKYIEIIRGKKEPPKKIQNNMQIKSYTPPQFQQLIGQSGQLIDNVIKISQSLERIVDAFGTEENIENINKTIASISNSAQAIEKSLQAIENQPGVLHSLIYEAQLSNDLDNTLANISSASDDISGEDGIAAELKEAAANFREISEMLRGGEGTLGALLIDPTVYDNLKGVLGQADRSRFVRAAVKYLLDEKAKNSDEP
ncbi:MlaD family protein [Desulfobacterota bacterium AH_259_B03_O07]|nr:MlaD family protein [Desulfobacterota bacterium AH_259_B03_O07]